MLYQHLHNENVARTAARFAGVINPVDLYGSSLQLWVDFSQIGTLFQDSAGTTPVTANGQPIGRANDLSGKNNHVTQTTLSRRPIYTTSAINSLSVSQHTAASFQNLATFPLSPDTSSGNVTALVVMKPLAGATGTKYVLTNGDGSLQNNTWGITNSQNSGTSAGGYIYSNAGTLIWMIAFNMLPNPTGGVVSFYANADTTGAMFLNAVQVAQKTTTDTVIGQIRGVNIGSKGNLSTTFFQGQIGEVILASNSEPAKRQLAEYYLRLKWGF